MVSFVRPHHPFDPPARWLDLYRDPDALALPPGWTDAPPPRDLARHGGYFPHERLTPAALRRVLAHYYACVSQIDFQVGRLLGLLGDRGLLDDTLVVFTSDHGDYLGHHHLLLKQGLPYDPLVRVPMIVRWPGGRRAGAVRAGLTSHVDLAPTLLRAAGIEPPAAMRGLDLADPDATDPLVFAEGGGPQAMVRSATEKLVLTRPGQPDLYFDLAADPRELRPREVDGTNDGGPVAERVAALRAAALGWRLFDAPPPAHLDESAATVGCDLPRRRCETAAETAAYFDRAVQPHLAPG